MSHQAILQRHDPLCPAANAPCSCNLCNPYCTCDSLRAAYQRGREDAAKASDIALRKASDEPQPAGADDPYSFANGFTYAGLIAIAAARGDGA